MSQTSSTQTWSLGSGAPSPLDALPPEAREQLSILLDEYLQRLSQGLPCDGQRLVAEHPELAPALELYLANLRELHGAAAAFGGAPPADPPPEDLAPEDQALRLGDYLLLRELGRGGMGVVYEARQISLARRVALKVLPFASVLDAVQILRFKNEAQAAAQLHHPHIVPVYAVGSEHGVHYYAMQYIDGEPLDRLIDAARQRAGKPPLATVDTVALDDTADLAQAPRAARSSATNCLADQWSAGDDYLRRVVELCAHAADALHAAHACGVVHRDVKPSNLLLDVDGKLWVTDFGLARFQTDSALTQTGHVVGTRQYMSPEQALGHAALVDQRSDVYSLGATLYELLTLEPVLPRHLTGPFLYDHWQPTSPRSIESRISRDLETVVLKALATEREERYFTAAELAADLRRVLAGEPTVARPPSAIDRAGRWAQRHRKAVAGAMLAGMLLLVGLAVSLAFIQRERVATQRNFERAERNFHQAQKAVDQLGTQLANRLAEVPGAEAVRRDLLEQTGDYYRQFISQAGDDPALQLELALTYSKLGGVHRQLGGTDEAIAAARQALDLLRQLKANNPRELIYDGRTAVCLNNLALELASAGRTDEATAALGEAIRLQSELVAQEVDLPASQLALALSHNNLGDVQRQTGNTVAARASFETAIGIQERLLRHDNRDDEVLRQLAASYSNLSAVSDDAALPLQRKAIAYLRLASDMRPNDLRHRREMAQALNNLGAAEARAGHDPAAADAYREAIRLQTSLVENAPLDRTHRRELAVSSNNLGLCSTRLRQPAEAERCFRAALDLQQPLVADNPRDPELNSTLGGIYNNLGFVLEGQERPADAAESYRRAVEHQQTAFEQAPNVQRYRAFLSKHYFNRGRVLRRLGQADLAAQVAMERKALWPGDAQRLLSVAEELAAAAQQLKSQTDGEVAADRCALLAIDTLKESLAAGLTKPEQLKQSTALAALRSHPQFVALFNPSSRRQDDP